MACPTLGTTFYGLIARFELKEDSTYYQDQFKGGKTRKAIYAAHLTGFRSSEMRLFLKSGLTEEGVSAITTYLEP